MCAFDNKRYLLADGINTLALGHRDIVQNVEEDRENVGNSDKVLTDRQARELGLLWKRRVGFEKHLLRIPYRRNEENEGDAIAADVAQRNRVQHLIDQVPNIPYRFQPISPKTRRAIGHTARNQPPLKSRRVQRREECNDLLGQGDGGSDSDDEAPLSIGEIPEKRRRRDQGLGAVAFLQDEVEVDDNVQHNILTSDSDGENSLNLDNSFIVSDIVFD